MLKNIHKAFNKCSLQNKIKNWLTKLTKSYTTIINRVKCIILQECSGLLCATMERASVPLINPGASSRLKESRRAMEINHRMTSDKTCPETKGTVTCKNTSPSK